MKDIKRVCKNCGHSFLTKGKNEHKFCSLHCMADYVTDKRPSLYTETPCWLWHDEDAQLTNRDTNEAFSLREALLNEKGITTKDKFVDMKCERSNCVCPDHIMVSDSPDEFAFYVLMNQVNMNYEPPTNDLGTTYDPFKGK